MVEIRIDVVDSAHVHALVRRLHALFGRPSVTYDGSREVRVCSASGSRAINEVVDAVQRWMEEADGGPTKIAVGDRSFTLEGRSLGEVRT